MGQFVETEVQNAQGRADCVIRTQTPFTSLSSSFGVQVLLPMPWRK